MSMKSNKNVSAQHLLESQGYGGWLEMLKPKSFFSSNAHQYCVLHDGHFYYFKEATSKTAKGVFSLVGYSAVEDDSKNKIRWVIKLSPSGINRGQKYIFASGSSREQQDWIEAINKEIEKSSPPLMYRGEGDGEDTDSDDSYDYTTQKPDDISFANPEQLVNTSSFTRQEAASFMTPNFEGPKFNLCDDEKPLSPMLPKPPPRLNKPNLFPSRSPDKTKTPDTTRKLLGVQSVPSYNPIQTSNKSKEGKWAYEFCNQPSYRNRTQDTQDGEHTDVYVDMGTRTDEGHYENPDTFDQDFSDDVILPESVYKLDLNRVQADELLRKTGAIGLYLIRRGKDDKQVLCVFGREWSKHYIIFQKDGMKFLGPETEPQFKTLGHLIRYYMKNYLPTSTVDHKLKLSKPYCW